MWSPPLNMGWAILEEDLGEGGARLEDDLGGTSVAIASNVPVVHSNWKNDSQDNEDSDYGDLLNCDDEYKKNTLQDKLGGDEPYVDSDENSSFEIDTDVDVDVKDEVQHPAIAATTAIAVNMIGGIGRGRGTIKGIGTASLSSNIDGVNGRGRGTVKGRGTATLASNIGGDTIRGRGTYRGRGAAVAANIVGVIRRGRGSVSTTSNMGGVSGRVEGLLILHLILVVLLVWVEGQVLNDRE
ncbi:hypothetical protein FXO38_34260 [Capsicum annuum]|nr:hypothetical protein FXO38_34260 [Capsicum annuum]KAF3624749.1 hypothetical protein FXO37_31218 [Capsicum annuum]